MSIADERHNIMPRLFHGSQRGFGHGALLPAVAIFSVLGLIGIGISELLDLRGGDALLPPGVMVGCFVLWVVGLHVLEAVRDKRRK